MKYRETKVVNYRQEDDDSNTLLTCTFLDCNEYRTDYDRQIDTTRQKRALGIQYKHESKEDIAGFISKPVASVMLFQCGSSPFKFKSFSNKFRIWNNSSSCFMCSTSKIY